MGFILACAVVFMITHLTVRDTAADLGGIFIGFGVLIGFCFTIAPVKLYCIDSLDLVRVRNRNISKTIHFTKNKRACRSSSQLPGMCAHLGVLFVTS